MAFEPEFSVTARLLQTVETIAALRERIAAATVQVAWISALQKDARVRNTHSSTAIEGNPLTLEQVRELEEGRPLAAVAQRSQREVLNYFAGLRFMEKNAQAKTLHHEHVLRLHSIITFLGGTPKSLGNLLAVRGDSSILSIVRARNRS